MKFKFNADNLQDNGVMAISGVTGGMASGAITAITPSQYKKAGKVGHVILGLVIASSASGKDTSANAVKGFGVGLALKSGFDLATEGLRKIVPVNSDKTDMLSVATQGALGMKASFQNRIPTSLLGEYSGGENYNDGMFSGAKKAYQIKNL